MKDFSVMLRHTVCGSRISNYLSAVDAASAVEIFKDRTAKRHGFEVRHLELIMVQEVAPA